MAAPDPEHNVTYQLRWPHWLAEQATEAASGKTMPLSVWLRHAAMEKLERDKKGGSQT